MSRLLAFLFLCGSLQATEVLVVSDKLDNGVWVESLGTAVIVGRKGNTYSAVTARHVIRDSYDGKIVGREGIYPITIGHVLKDQSLDFALLKFDATEEFKPAGFSGWEPEVDGKVTWSGYHSSGTKYERMDGIVARKTAECYWVRGNSEVRSGQSGGGVYRDGKLIGVVSVHLKEIDTGKVYMGFTPMCHVNRGCQREWGWHFGIQVPPAYPPKRQPWQQPWQRQNPGPVPPASDEPAPAPPTEPAPPRHHDAEPTRPAAPQADYSGEIESLKAEIARLQSQRIPVQILNPDGSIHDKAVYKIGNPIQLKLSPVKK